MLMVPPYHFCRRAYHVGYKQGAKATMDACKAQREAEVARAVKAAEMAWKRARDVPRDVTDVDDEESKPKQKAPRPQPPKKEKKPMKKASGTSNSSSSSSVGPQNRPEPHPEEIVLEPQLVAPEGAVSEETAPEGEPEDDTVSLDLSAASMDEDPTPLR